MLTVFVEQPLAWPGSAKKNYSPVKTNSGNGEGFIKRLQRSQDRPGQARGRDLNVGMVELE